MCVALWFTVACWLCLTCVLLPVVSCRALSWRIDPFVVPTHVQRTHSRLCEGILARYLARGDFKMTRRMLGPHARAQDAERVCATSNSNVRLRGKDPCMPQADNPGVRFRGASEHRYECVRE